ncbi:MAG TPA: hypothetical protein VGC86_01380 [Afipia sp.]
MNKDRKSRDRQDWVYGIVDARESGKIEATYDFERNAIDIVGAEPGSTKTVRSYERASGKPKVTSSVPSTGTTMKAFDYVVAIDTNSRMIGGKKCAVCFSYFAPKCLSAYEDRIPFLPLTAYFIIGINDTENPERIGWHLTLTRNIIPAYRADHGRIAVVSDSELGLHTQINARKVGYYDNQMLPDWATIVYGSDKERDTLQGAMLALCHQGADRLLNELEKLPEPFAKQTGGDGAYEGFAEVRFKR